MKWLFFLLLLINIGVFVWIYPQQTPSPAEPTPLPGVKRLLLLGETQQATQPGVGDQPSDTKHEEAVGQAMPAYRAGSSSAERPVSAPEASSEVADGSSIPPEADQRERPAASPSDRPNPTARSAGPVDRMETAPPRQCRRIGPLDKRGQLDKLSLSLMAMGIQTDPHTESVEEQDGYWVMIPPLESREAAVAIVKQLRDAGISDLWRFTSGSLANAISLGLFRNESRAEIRRKALEGKGFETEVRPRYRQKNSYWLDFSFSGRSPLSETDWQRIVEIYPGVEQRSLACDALDSQ